MSISISKARGLHGAPAWALGLALACAACPQEGPASTSPRSCCEQPKIPPGVTPFVVVGDDVSGPSDGQKVILSAGLSQPAKRDQIYPALQALYVHAMKRGTFEPIQFVATLYGSESTARRGGSEDVIGRIVREQSDVAPKCENKVPYDFSEQVARTFAAAGGRPDEEDPNDTCHIAPKKVVARFDDKFMHKPSYKADAARQAVDLTYPYLEMGKDEYAQDLNFNAAMRDWVESVTTYFRRVDGLREMSFTGIWRDQPVVKITVDRPQFESSLASLQESVASHAAITFAELGLHRKSDKAAAKEQSETYKKTYKAALARLPKNQVFVSPKLK